MMIKRRTLRFQIYVAILLTFSVMTLLFGVIIYPFEKQRRKTVIDKIKISINAIVQQSEEELANSIFLQHKKAVEVIMQKILQVEGITTICVYNPDGSLFSSTDTALTSSLSASERQTLSSEYSFTEGTYKDQPALTYAKTVAIVGETIGYLKIYYSLVPIAKETHLVIIIFIITLFTMLFSMSLILNTLLGNSVVRPIGVLMNAMRKVQQGNFGLQVDLQLGNEIGEMAKAFNQMSSENYKMYQQIYDLNRNLELKVNERTAELTELNRQLQKEIAERKKMVEEREALIKELQENQDLLKRQNEELEISRRAIKNVAEDLEKSRGSLEQQKNYLEEANRELERQKQEVEASRSAMKNVVKDLEKSKGDLEEKKKFLEDANKELQRQKQEVEASRRAIKNVAEDLRLSKQALEEQKGSVEKINKELDDFTYIVSHDLKEPLRSIDAFSKFLEIDYKERIDDEGKDYIRRIRTNASRMQNLIEDLLELSRIERRQNPFDEVEIEELVNEVKLRLEYRIKEKNVEIITPVKFPKVTCDRVRLTEVFVNLVSNAIKFNDKPTPRIEIGSSLKGIFYEFYVKDNGPGIEEQYFDKIFEIFQRLGRREDSEGTGAGLTIVKKIVEMHKGKVWVESKVGEGATFYFTIPKEKEFILGKKKLGEILIEKKLVTEEDIKKALQEQERIG